MDVEPSQPKPAASASAPRVLSANVQKLKFMQSATVAMESGPSNSDAPTHKAGGGASNTNRIKVDWHASDVDMTKFKMPRGFQARERAEPARAQHRRSYRGFNPAVQKFEQTIARRIRQAEEDQRLAATLRA